MKITAQAPCRVDLAGGTLDIWPLYLFHPHAITVNFAVDRCASCTLEVGGRSTIVLRSIDLDAEQSYKGFAGFNTARRHKLPLLTHVLRFFAPEVERVLDGAGLTITTGSEAPAGAGISGSSALIIALSSALNRFTSAGYTLERLREISQNIEAQMLRVPTGAQDYYPAMYGRVSALSMGPVGLVREEIPINLEAFDERIVLAYTGLPRNSGINNWEVMKAHIDGDRVVHRNFEQIAAIANAMRDAVAKSDWRETGHLLRREWANRRKNAPGISTPLIDRLIQVTRRAGATGAKVCGAGGGGCVFFLVEEGTKAKVASAIKREGATVLPVKVAREGVTVRATRGRSG